MYLFDIFEWPLTKSKTEYIKTTSNIENWPNNCSGQKKTQKILQEDSSRTNLLPKNYKKS